MKYFFRSLLSSLLLLLSLFTGYLLFSSFSSSGSAVEFDVWAWVVKNWAIIALFISELAALLPGKVSGIIDLLVKIIGSVIDKQKK